MTLTEFPDALHLYDKVEFPNPVKLDFSDPCLERGWQFGYNAVAYEATLASVKSFLRTTFNIK